MPGILPWITGHADARYAERGDGKQSDHAQDESRPPIPCMELVKI
jgi:hypothetical protein